MQSGITDDSRASFGQFLISSRTRAGVSLEAISSTTKVTVRQLQALESGRVEVLPGGVYRRSIVRGYAAAIGLNPEIALDWFDRTFGSEAAPPFRLETPENPATTQRMIRFAPSRAVLAVAALVVIAAVVAPLALPDEEEQGRGDQRGVMAGAAAAPIRSAMPVVSTAAPPTPATSRTADQSPVPASRRRARVRPGLVVTSRPAGARVTVDGIGRGVTPLTVPYLPPGEKVVRVTKDGYLARQLTVRVSDDGSAAVRTTLRPRASNGPLAAF